MEFTEKHKDEFTCKLPIEQTLTPLFIDDVLVIYVTERHRFFDASVIFNANRLNLYISSFQFMVCITCSLKSHHVSRKIGIDAFPEDLVDLSDNFHAKFQNAGFCRDYKCLTIPVLPSYDGPITTLGDILESNVDEKYYIPQSDVSKWEYMKGPKKEKRIGKNGFEYNYSEGPILYPDYLDRPGRTMLTSEGSKNRSSHLVKDPQTGRLRILTPVECERLDGFPDNWTNTMPERMRYFCMGNALVVGLIEIMGRNIK